MTSETLQFGDLVIDVDAFRIERDGVPVALTPRAFDVLLYLIRHRGRIVEKQEIFDAVWGDAFVTDNALTRVIKEIRRGLGDDVANPRYIETVPKRGYRFVAVVSGGPLSSDAVSTSLPVDLRRERWSPKFIYPAAVAALIVLGAATWLFFRDQPAKGTSGPISSIAVLPFRNDSPEADTDYLASGIAESLRNDLSLFSELKVISQASASRYKDDQQDPQRIARELNVRALLTGSLKEVGDQLVINVSLDDLEDDRHIWGDQYVRNKEDLLAIQNDIAKQTLSKLRTRLSAHDSQQLNRRDTENVEAYQLYLKAGYYWNKHSEPDFRKAIGFLNEAIEKDPNFARAYAGLAACYGSLGNNYLRPRDAFPRAKEYAEQAVRLGDDVAAAHAATAANNLFYDWDFPAAEREVRHAIELDPNNPEAHQMYGDYLEIHGRFDEALIERDRSLDIGPLSPTLGMVKGATFYFAHRYDEAELQLQKTIDLEPRFLTSYFFLGQVYEKKKMYDRALATYESGMKDAERSPWLIAAKAHAFGMQGDRENWKRSLTQLQTYASHSYISPYLFALSYAGVGDRDKVFTYLNEAYDDRSFFLIWLNVEPAFEDFRSDARFQDLTRRVGL